MSVFLPVYRLRLIRDANFRAEAKMIHAPADAAAILAAYLDGADREQFVALTLDNKGRATGLHTVAIGTLNRVEVHLRDVFKFAVLMDAASIIVGHNHPSGDPDPSPDDHQLTQRLKRAGELLGIPLLDHLVIGDQGSFVSLIQDVSGHVPVDTAAES